MNRAFGVESLLQLLKFYAQEFVFMASALKEVETTSEIISGTHLDELLDEEHLEHLKNPVDLLRKICQKHHLTSSVKKCERILYHVKVKGASIRQGELTPLLRELRERIEDDLDSQCFLHMEPKEAEEFLEPLRGWEVVCDRFGEAIRDIEEMRKCFALNRYPASVFHSMQVVEHGLIHIGAWMGIKDHKPGWSATTAELRRIVNAAYDKRTDWEKQHFAFIEQMQQVCQSLMTAWRHKIDHAAGRLVLLPGDFAPEIAKDIIDATRAFMLRLAIELPTDFRP